MFNINVVCHCPAIPTLSSAPGGLGLHHEIILLIFKNGVSVSCNSNFMFKITDIFANCMYQLFLKMSFFLGHNNMLVIF